MSSKSAPTVFGEIRIAVSEERGALPPACWRVIATHTTDLLRLVCAPCPRGVKQCLIIDDGLDEPGP